MVWLLPHTLLFIIPCIFMFPNSSWHWNELSWHHDSRTVTDHFFKKKRKWRTDVSKCFQQWHIVGSHYQVTRRLLWKEQNLRQENIIISEKKIVSGNFVITHHNVMFESWCWLKATAWKWNWIKFAMCSKNVLVKFKFHWNNDLTETKCNCVCQQETSLRFGHKAQSHVTL